MPIKSHVEVNHGQSDDVPEELEVMIDLCKWNRFNKPVYELTILKNNFDPSLRVKNNINHKFYPLSPKVSLTSREQHTSLMTGRHSAQRFCRTAVSVATLRSVLNDSIVRNRIQREQEFDYFRGPYPSAGGLYPIETYIFAKDIDGLEIGVYNVDTAAASMSKLLDADIDALEQALNLQDDMMSTLSFVSIHTCVLSRFIGKYGVRGYRFCMLEAGHIAQNLLISAKHYGLGSLCWGGYYDDEVASALGVPQHEESLLHCVIYGTEHADRARRK